MREEFWKNIHVPAGDKDFNKYLEFAGRVADFLELGQLMALDALQREESCGAHFREEYQTPEGEAKRDDDRFSYVSAWEYRGDDNRPRLNKESLVFEEVALAMRSYQ